MTIRIDGTTGISGVDGTATAPAVQGNDTNTGVFFPANDTIAFAEGGTEVMRIDANGNVGIGTSSPANRLHLGSGSVRLTDGQQVEWGGSRNAIEGSESSNYIRLWTNNLARLVVDSSGRVTMPSQPAFHAFLTNTTSFAAGISARTLDNVQFNIGNHFNTSTGRFTAPVLGTYVFYCNISLNSSTQTQAYISAELYLNGNRQYVGGWVNRVTASNSYLKVGTSYMIRLNPGDYVQLGCEIHQTENVIGGSGHTYMTGYLVG